MKLPTLSLLLALTLTFTPTYAAFDSNAAGNSSEPIQKEAAKAPDPLEDVLKSLRAAAETVPTEEPRAQCLWSCIVNIEKTIYGPDSPLLIEDLRKLAECLRFLYFDKSEILDCRSMSLYGLKLDLELESPDPFIVSYDLNVLADNYMQEEDVVSADLLMDKAVEADKKGGKDGEVCLVRDLMHSAMLKRLRFNYEGAAGRITNAIELHEKLYGPHPTDEELFQSASKNKDTKPYKYDTAIVELERLTEKDKQTLEAADPHAGLDLFQLADAYFCLNHQDLIPHSLWKRAHIIETIAATERIRGKGDISSKSELADLADSLASAHELKRAEKLMLLSSKIEDKYRSEGVIEGQLRLARFYLKSKQFKESQDQFKEILQKYAAGGFKIYSPDAWTGLAESYDRDNKEKLAQSTYEVGLSFFTKRKDNTSLCNILRAYAGFQRSRGKFDEAEKLREKAEKTPLGNE